MLKKIARTKINEKKLKNGEKRYFIVQSFRDTEKGDTQVRKTLNTYDEADEYLSKLISDVRRGEVDPFVDKKKKKAEEKAYNNNIAFEKVATDWVNWRYKMIPKRITKESFVNEKIQLEKYIIPMFFGKKLTEISAEDCERSLSYWKGRGYKSISALKSVVNRIFIYGIKNKKIKILNPIDGVCMENSEDKEELRKAKEIMTFGNYHGKVITPDKVDHYELAQAVEFFKCAEKMGISRPIYVVLLLLFSSGVRVGEALALQWEDIHFEDGNFDIRKTAVERHAVSRTKTNGSIRIVILSKTMLKDLKKWKREEKKIFKDNNVKFNDKSFLFCRMIPGHWDELLESEQINDVMTKICHFSGKIPRMTPHGFRHTYISLAKANGDLAEVISNAVGHNNLKTTKNYTHELDIEKEEVAKKINNLQEAFGIHLGEINEADIFDSTKNNSAEEKR